MRLFLCILAVAVVTGFSGHQPFRKNRPRPGRNGPLPMSGDTPTSANCTKKFITQFIDHFNWGPLPKGASTYQQRYFVYEKYWQKPTGPIFFYAGNEADVTLYVNHTGLIWENAQAFGAYIIFAEHRYWGESLPFGADSFDPSNLHWIVHEQALADYAALIYQLKQDIGAPNVPVITFGGSYGGMLSAWLRIKYPSAVAGAIAASAPILAFDGMTPAWDSEKYWAVVTRDATSAGGTSDNCAKNVLNSWAYLFNMGSTSSGRQQLQKIFKICTPIQTSDDVNALALFVKFAWDTMAMGNYPYPSSYLTGGVAEMPAFPVRAGCAYLTGNFSSPDGSDLLAALSDAVAVYNNATHDLQCYDLPTDIEEDGIWDYLWCTEMLPQETYFTCDGVNDMFYPMPFNMTFIQQRCASEYNVQPRPTWIRVSYGDRTVDGASNIVFSNGNYDPWSSGGVSNSLSDTVVAVLIDQGAHHLDLMFSDPQDPISVLNARAIELEHITVWIKNHNLKYAAN